MCYLIKSPDLLASYRVFMSPPAQKAFPPAPLIHTALTSDWFQSVVAAFKILIISMSKEFKVFGLFKIALAKYYSLLMITGESKAENPALN